MNHRQSIPRIKDRFGSVYQRRKIGQRVKKGYWIREIRYDWSNDGSGDWSGVNYRVLLTQKDRDQGITIDKKAAMYLRSKHVDEPFSGQFFAEHPYYANYDKGVEVVRGYALVGFSKEETKAVYRHMIGEGE